MPQTLKPEVRAQMLGAAEIVFARLGYQGATMAAIAKEAGVSAGNLYRYFENKDALFYAAITDEFAASFLRLLERRVGSLVAAPDLTHLPAQAEHDGQDLLRFWVEHRPKVIVLLARSAGSRHEGFAERFVEVLLHPTLAVLRERSGCKRLPAVVRTTLRDIFDNTVRTIVSILERHESEARVRQAFEAFWSYQLAGLAGFERWVTTS